MQGALAHAVVSGLTDSAAFLLVDPLYPLAVHPLSDLPFAVFQEIFAAAVLLAVLPAADIFASVGPVECPVPLFLVIFVLALIFAAVSPLDFTEPMHFVMLPIPHILPVLAPDVLPCIKSEHTFSMDLVVEELSLVVASIDKI